MTTSNPSKAYFESVAEKWDDMRAGYFGEGVRQAAIQHAYLHSSMEVADMGSGSGFIALGLTPLVRQVHVIDGSPAMLEVARKNLAAFKNITFHQADAFSVPLADGSLDAVFANMYLHHCPDPLAAIREMTRLLRPGGRLVISDADAHDQQWMKTEMADIWLGFERQQVRSWLAQAGLVNVIVDGSGETCKAGCASASGDKAEIGIFVAVGTKKVEARRSVRAAYAARALSSDCGCGGSDCCSPSSSEPTPAINEQVIFNSGYSASEMGAVPSEAAQLSLGCGNPGAMAAIQTGDTVLDIGSGAGMDAFLAAQRVGVSGRVIGIDMTPAMLNRARAAAEKNGITNVDFRMGYAEQMPVDADSVDVILSNCVINLVEDKGAVFQEALRVLKPGGRLEVNDMVFGGAVPPALLSSANGWAGCVSGALPEQEYVDLVRQAGFTDIRVARSTSGGMAAGVEVYSIQLSARKP